MNAAGPRALSTSSAAARVCRLPTASRRRGFHATRRLRKTPDADTSVPPPDSGKPQSKSQDEQHDARNASRDDRQAETQPELPVRRVKTSSGGGSPFRQRPLRSRTSDDLPPVKLPRTFLDNNIFPLDPSTRQTILASDPMWHRGYVGAQWHDWLWHDMEVVFDEASWTDEDLQRALRELSLGNPEGVDIITRRSAVLGETAQWMDLCLRDMWSPVFSQPFEESDVPKELSVAFLAAKSDSAIVSAILDPDRKTDARRTTVASRDNRAGVGGDDAFLRERVRKHILQTDQPDPVATEEGSPSPELAGEDTLTLEDHGSRIYDPKLLGELATALRADFVLPSDPAALRKDLKRPLLVVHIPNYSGTYPTRKLMQRIAAHVEADLIQIGAQDLAAVVGSHLGQDTAHSRGSMAMLAYRAAEMNGRLAKGPEVSVSSDDDMSGEIEAAWVNIRQHASGGSYKSPFEEELQKIREDAKDYVLPSVDRWENLKINAALEGMIHAAMAKSSDPSRPLIVHVDNFVELSMTLEGAVLLGRLRSIVDGLWRDGKKAVLVGSSTNEDPSEQYSSALGEIAAEEFLFHFPLMYQRIPNWETKKERREAIDYLQENLRNIQFMSRTLSEPIGSAASGGFSGFLEKSEIVPELMEAIEDAGLDITALPLGLSSSVLPCPDVYHFTRLYHGHHHLDEGSRTGRFQGFLDVVKSRGPLAPFSQSALEAENHAAAAVGGGSPQSSTKPKSKSEPDRVQANGKYNEFEKKLLAGLVDGNEIHTTFADVHAPAETIAALKLLTSLSLVRPEAFSYGVLATDRIPGCLLYGPPGTGKTLLAKAVAKESGASMLEVSGASINDMYVGQSEKNVRALFSLAKKLSPLVIFIDEADALFAARGGQSRARPSHRETINQFLREWDGLNDAKAFIMVATNRPFDLDDAVLRRLPRKILVDLPLQPDRAAILRILLKDERLDPSVDIDEIASRCVLYSGSDLKNLCVAAAMAAVQEELEEAARHAGPTPYVYPERRTLSVRHFNRAADEIAASISEDMDSLKAIRQFDQKYGDHRSRRRKPRAMGFGVVPGSKDSEDARVRQPISL
ncbi:hypothetical protein ACRALDRAFT_2027497 [Sodiomyces alcalophilus JCM 7366]|uniref:uncharacterized protein n=1 Tax=Sodiomyces alcalophilus JCM 7366 TaxID=591952 RepID=UPI0039B6DC75